MKKIILGGISLLVLTHLLACSSLREGGKDLYSQENMGIKFLRPIWIKNLDPDYETGNLPISFHSPLVHDGLVFLGDPKGDMWAYNLEDGRPVWQEHETRGISNRPTIFNKNVLYGTEEGRLISREYATGALVYSVDLGESLEAPISIAGNMAFAHLRNHKIVTLDAITGKILWTYKRTIAQSTTVQEVSMPVVYKNRLYVGFADGVMVAFSLEDGAIVWEQNLGEDAKFADIHMAPLFKDNVMYAGSLAGPLTVLNASTGDILRRYPFRAARAPLFIEDDKKMIVGTTDGEVMVIDTTSAEILREVKIGVPVYGMSLWMDKILVATRRGTLLLLNQSDLKTAEQFSLGTPFSIVFGEFSIVDNKMALYSSRNRLYVFEKLF